MYASKHQTHHASTRWGPEEAWILERANVWPLCALENWFALRGRSGVACVLNEVRWAAWCHLPTSLNGIDTALTKPLGCLTHQSRLTSSSDYFFTYMYWEIATIIDHSADRNYASATGSINDHNWFFLAWQKIAISSVGFLLLHAMCAWSGVLQSRTQRRAWHL